MTDRTILASNASVYTLAEISFDFYSWVNPSPLLPDADLIDNEG